MTGRGLRGATLLLGLAALAGCGGGGDEGGPGATGSGAEGGAVMAGDTAGGVDPGVTVDTQALPGSDTASHLH